MAKILIISNDGEATFYEDYVLPTDLYYESTMYDLEKAVVEALDYEDEQNLFANEEVTEEE